MRKWINSLAIIGTVCVLAGCQSEEAPKIRTVSIMEDGTIEHMVIAPFDTNYYDAEELFTMAQEKAARFSDGSGDIVCESVETSDGQVIVKMVYQSEENYTEFNNRELFVGTVAEAGEKGYSLQELLSGSGAEFDQAVLSELAGKQVVVIQTKAGEELDINVYGKILYASANLTLSGKKDAVVTAGEEEQISCVIFQ